MFQTESSTDLKPGFIKNLEVEYDGEGEWKLLDEMEYVSLVEYPRFFKVPKGFTTDFASVPRVPFIYAFFGNIAHRPSVLHDHLYRSITVRRDVADLVFLEAMRAEGTGHWKSIFMYAGVRLFGWKYYGRFKKCAIQLF